MQLREVFESIQSILVYFNVSGVSDMKSNEEDLLSRFDGCFLSRCQDSMDTFFLVNRVLWMTSSQRSVHEQEDVKSELCTILTTHTKEIIFYCVVALRIELNKFAYRIFQCCTTRLNFFTTCTRRSFQIVH